jgi:hypothetical protein
VDFSLTPPNANDLKIHCVTSRRVQDGGLLAVHRSHVGAGRAACTLYNGREPIPPFREYQAVKSDVEIAELRARLLVLDRERQELQKRLEELTSVPSSYRGLRSPGGAGQVINASPVAAKVALFRRLFAGRSDVYPVRWENMSAEERVCPGMFERVAQRNLRETPGEVYGVLQPSLHCSLGRDD